MNTLMNNFSLDTGETSLVLSKSIMIYTKAFQRAHQSGEDAALYATVHDVKNFGTDANPDFQIAAGSPITQEALLAMFEQLAKRHSLNTDLIPEHVLSISADHMVWWMPAVERNVFFNTRELGKRGAKVPHPALVFAVVQGNWFVFALAKNERPTEKTPLHYAPYFNVYDAGNICIGSARVPKAISAKTIPVWQDAFFDSEFTHVNGSKRKSSHPRGEYAMWKELLDGVYKAFPIEYLVPMGSTIDSLMKGVRQKLGAAN
jgi:PRTRC genetic system protein B